MTDSSNNNSPKHSIVIPVYNEEDILKREMLALKEELHQFLDSFEIVLVENGSTDSTREICEWLKEEYSVFYPIYSPVADPGKAVQKGTLEANGDIVTTQEVDNWDIDYIKKSLELIEEYDIIHASKNHPDADWANVSSLRIILTKGFNNLLYILFGFEGTDTHGPKTFRKEKFESIVEDCSFGWGIYRAELTLRAQYGNFKTLELPLNVREIRKTRVSIAPRIVKNFYYLSKLYIKFHRENIFPDN